MKAESASNGKSWTRWFVPLVLLIVSVVVFWVLPSQLPDRTVRIEYSTANR